MGLKKIYNLLKPDWIGRDSFIAIGVEYGLGVKKFVSYHRTTFSSKSAWFVNLTAGLTICDINRVWVSDITYIRISEIFYYITFIEDIYSRRILGYTAYRSLEAEANCIALKMALREREGMNIRGLIHHSDRGVQYTSNKYLQLLSTNKIGVSMCDSVYENTHIERVNGTIKNEYLHLQNLRTFENLQKELANAVKLYNEDRPHWSLDCKSPVRYEEELRKVPLEYRKKMIMYSEKASNIEQESLF
jgi:transposase InsO family protein